MNQTPEYMSPREASRAYPVAYITLLRWLSDGTLTRYTVGSGAKRPRLMVRVTELEDVLTPTPADRASA